MQFKKIDRTSVSEEIIEYLKDQILSRKLEPGTQLPSEEKLAENMGVGRGTVREALRVLLYLGLIERRNNATYVCSILPSVTDRWELTDRIRQYRDHIEMMEIRRIIEPRLAALAAERADEEDIARLERHLESMRGEQHELEKFIDDDNQFHLYIFAAAGNSLFQEILRSVQEIMKNNQSVVLRERPNIMPRSLKHHEHILEAIKAHKPAEAERRMQDHIEDIEHELNIIMQGSRS